jgi:hypothetical protein
MIDTHQPVSSYKGSGDPCSSPGKGRYARTDPGGRSEGDHSMKSTALFPQLQAFLVVARLRSFSGAARELGVSRSAVSQAVQHLEEQLRVVLLARTTRSVSLTDAGRRLVETSGPAVGQVFAALSGVSAQPGEAVGRLRLSVPARPSRS